ncbi:PRC-barrel domain-containing protein [Sedimentitalea nanhaiensis]|nr:PRC-barrel domain-containing protein [Sedimentitalea nanhaiensis]
MTGFMDYSVTNNDLLASEFIGMRVYRAEEDVDVMTNMAPDAQTEWDDIGEINELVISPDGNVIAVIVGVGGFLGVGEKDVAMDMNQIHILREADDADDYFLVIKSSSDALKAAPSFARDMNKPEMDAAAEPKRSMLMAPDVKREGYAKTERTELTTEMLTGARVYGVDDEDVGEIHSLLLDDKGAIERAVIDVGGFLGMGEKPVAVTFDELTILRKDGGDEVQVYIDSSQEALKAQPTYEK